MMLKMFIFWLGTFRERLLWLRKCKKRQYVDVAVWPERVCTLTGTFLVTTQ